MQCNVDHRFPFLIASAERSETTYNVAIYLSDIDGYKMGKIEIINLMESPQSNPFISRNGSV